jgi:hypothetical protein
MGERPHRAKETNVRLRIPSIIIVLFISVTIFGVAMLPSQSATSTSVHPHHKAKIISGVLPFGLTAMRSTTIPPAPTTTTTVAPAPDLYAAWSRVATCEEGGWIGYSGSAYPNSLGINATNWYGTASRIGADPSDMSPANQIKVAEALRAEYGMGIPDQDGCAPW